MTKCILASATVALLAGSAAAQEESGAALLPDAPAIELIALKHLGPAAFEVRLPDTPPPIILPGTLEQATPEQKVARVFPRGFQAPETEDAYLADPPVMQVVAREHHRPRTFRVPLPLPDADVVFPGTLEPLTDKEKAARALRNMVGFRAVANRVMLASLKQGMDRPYEWGQGMDGYGKRLASGFGRLAVRRALELGTDVAFNIDSRYDRCACSGFLARSGHAWRRVFVARKDDGSEMINVTRLTAAYVTPIITDQWYPSRLNTWERKLNSGSQYLMWRGVGNMIREFWPQISRKLPVGKDLYR